MKKFKKHPNQPNSDRLLVFSFFKVEYNNGGQYNVEAWIRADTSVNLKLSALLLNGLCVTPAPCSSGDERLTNTLGVNYPGAVWKITVTAMDTTVTHQMAMQLMHSGVEDKFMKFSVKRRNDEKNVKNRSWRLFLV